MIIFHDIRRTVETNMVNAGVDRVHRDLRIGRVLTGMDAHYLAPPAEDLIRAMARYSAWLDVQLQRVDPPNIRFIRLKRTWFHGEPGS